VEVGGEVITKPVPTQTIGKLCLQRVSEPREGLLLQEILHYLGVFIKTSPRTFAGFIKIRVNYLKQVLITEMSRKKNCSPKEAFELIMEMRPFDLKTMIQRMLDTEARPIQVYVSTNDITSLLRDPIHPPQTPKTKKKGFWLRSREIEGSLSRVPQSFYDKVYNVLEKCAGITIRDRTIDTSVTADMTRGEKNFALRVESLLDIVTHPAVRQLDIEAIILLNELLVGKTLTEHTVINLSEVIRYAIRRYQESRPADTQITPKLEALRLRNNAEELDEYALEEFADLSPTEAGGFIVQAFAEKYNLRSSSTI